MKPKTLTALLLTFLLLAFGAVALADNEVSIPAPDCRVPSALRAGEDLQVTEVDWLDESECAALGFGVREQQYHVDLYQIVDEVNEYVTSQSFSLNEFGETSFYTYADGYEAGSYFLRIKRAVISDNIDWYYSDPVDYPFTVTGVRPAAPNVEILTDNVLLGQRYEVRISAPGMEDFSVQYYDRDGYPSMGGSSSGITDGAVVYSLSPYEDDMSESWFNFRAKVDGCWSEWTGKMLFTWTVLGTLEAPDLTIADHLAGQPVTAALLNDYPAEAGLNWELYRVLDAENEEWVSSRYIDVDDLDDPSHLSIAPGGLDAGSYHLSIRSYANGYFDNKRADYTFTVTGSRPAAPAIAVNPDIAYFYTDNWFSVTAEGMTKYEISSCYEDGSFWYSSTYQVHDSSSEVKYREWSSNDEYRYYRVRVLVGGIWSDWTDLITLRWQSRGVLANPDLELPDFRAGEPVVLTVKSDLSDTNVYLRCTIDHLLGDDEEQICSNSVSRYNLDGRKQVTLVTYGLEAGIYRLTAYADGYGYTRSETVEYEFFVTGQRPAAPQTAVLVNNALQSQANQVRVSATGLQYYAVEYQDHGSDWWDPDSSAGSRKATNGEAVYTRARRYDDSLSLRFRGMVDGCWSEYTDPVTLTWTTRGPAAAPNLTLPANLRAGEPLVLTFAGSDTLAADEYLTVSWSDGEEGAEFGFNASDLQDGRLVVEQFGLDSGSYSVSAVREKTDYDESQSFTATFTVTGQRPAVPATSLSATSVYYGEAVILTVQAAGLESVLLDSGSWNEANYLASGGRAVIKWKPIWQTDIYCRAQFDGCWTQSFSAGHVDVKTGGDMQLSNIVPDLDNRTITVGQPFTFPVEVDPRTETFTVGIVLYEEENGEYHYLSEVEYEMIVDVNDGQVTLPAKEFTVPGVYCLNFSAYADDYSSVSTGGFYVPAVDSAPSAVTATITLHPGEGALAYRDLPLTISAPGASLVALKVVSREEENDSWYYNHTFRNDIPVSGGVAEYTIDDYLMDQGFYTFTARACVNGHWSDWGEPQTLSVTLPDEPPEPLSDFDILEAPTQVVSGEPFTVSWSASEGAQKYEVYYSIGGSGAISGTVFVPATQTSATLTIDKVPGQVQYSYEGYLNVYAIAEGQDCKSAGDHWGFELIDSEKPTVTASKTTLLPHESVTMTVAGLRANQLKVRINGVDKGYVPFATVNQSGDISLDFNQEGAYLVQVAVRHNITAYQYGIWSSWSNPVTLTVSDNLAGATLTLPESTQVIEQEAFMATDVACVIINDGCHTIENHAFADCPKLVRITIPASVTTINGDPFEGCTNLVIVTPENSAADIFAKAHGYTSVR